MIHFSGRKLGNPGVLTFPKIFVCLDCGSTWFRVPQNELERVRDSATQRS